MADTQLDIDEQVERIRLAREERDRSHNEVVTWLAESDKFQAEQRKLFEEALKLRGDKWISPVIAISATIAAVASVLNLILK